MKRVFLLVSIVLVLLLVFTGCQPKSPILKPPPAVIPPNAKIVCIFFDDCYQNQYDEAFSVLKQYDFKATFGVITGHTDVGSGLYQYMSTAELEELAKYGMDIGSHTITHPDLTTLSPEQLHAEIFDSKKTLEDMGFVVDTFIPPYYEWNEQVIDEIMAANYTCSRGSWTLNETFDPQNPDPEARFHVAAWQISNQNLTTFKAIVDKAGPNAVVCLVYHFITDDGPTATSTPVENFKLQMAYLNEAGFTVIPLCDLFRLGSSLTP